MRVWTWFIGSVIGLGLMVAAFDRRPRPDRDLIWANGLVVVGPERPKGPKLPGRAFATLARLLPSYAGTEAILDALEKAKPGKTLDLQTQLRPKLFLLPLAGAGIDAASLQSGRLPEADGKEVLAGSQARNQARLEVAGRTLAVVGVLKPDHNLFAESYLIPPSPSSAELFPDNDRAVHHAVVLGLTREQLHNRANLQAIEADYPSPRYVKFTHELRMGRGAYYFYLLGQALFLVAGSGVLIGLYRRASRRAAWPWLSAPLREMDRRWRLVWGVHLVYFGLVIASAVVIYELPDFQTVVVSAIRGQLADADGTGGPLAAAGRAYGSGSIPRAAAVTFLVNFFIGSLACITIPSMIVPGSGVFVAGLRALMWGGLLGPTLVAMAGRMIPHSGTMLLEGEGYILATIFALLIPVHLVETTLGDTLLRRFRRAIVLNVQATGLVALVLAVAAVYEATELIVMMRMM